MLDKIELTLEEKECFDEKVKIIKDVKRVFGNNITIGSNAFRVFTLKELVQDELNSLYLQTSNSDILRLIFYNICNVVDYFTYDEAEYYYNYICSLADDPSNKFYISSYIGTSDCISSVIKLFKTYKKPEGILKLLLKDVFVKNLNREKLLTYIDNFMSAEKIEDSLETINLVSSTLPTYKNFPLIIINPYIDNNEKIKAIKKTYRKSDLGKYKDFLSRNVNNWNDIDTFIEATVTQNNRITNDYKEDSYINVFKELFINNDSYSSKNIYENILNADSFRKKYAPMFKKREFLSKFIERSVNDYSKEHNRRKNNALVFTRFILNDISIPEICDLLTGSPWLKEYISNDFSSIYNNEKNKEYKDDLKNLFISWYDENRDIREYLELINSNNKPDAIIDTIKNSIVNNDNDMMEVLKRQPFIDLTLSSKEKKIITSGFRYKSYGTLTSIISCLGDDIIKYNYLGDGAFNLFLDNRYLGSRDYSMLEFEDVSDVARYYFKVLDSSIKNADIDTIELFKDAYLKKLNDETVISNIVDSTISFSSSSNYKYTCIYDKKSLTADYVTNVLSVYLDGAEKYIELCGEKDEEVNSLRQTLDDTIDSIKLLCSLS